MCIPSHAIVVGQTCHPLKVRLEEHQKTVYQGEVKKSDMADHICKEKGTSLPLWEEVKIIDGEEHWRIRCLKETMNMLVYSDLLSRPFIEMNMI